MISDVSGRQLHDRAVRGESLSAEEHRQLEEWLATQDRLETELLAQPIGDSALADLRSQVHSALEQMTAVTRNIQQISEANESLRRENAALRRRLASGMSAQPA